MKSSVSTILSEIFEYDPTLRFKESEIRSYLEILLKNKPEVKASPELISSLKFKLMNSISPPPKSTINWKSILAGFLGGGAAVSFAAYGLWNTEILSVAPP